MPSKIPVLRPFNGSAIPQALKAHKRWAPWCAVWNEKRQKFDKIPHRADRPAHGISTAKPEQWFSFESAQAAYLKNPSMFAGVGYVLTGPHGIVGTDLDKCVDNGEIAPWAADVVAKLNSYTEISPSGNGLRILSFGELPNDWNNHEVGIEIYGGNEARFLTITGEHLSSAPMDVRAPADGVLKSLEARYAKERRKADVIDLNMPEQLDELLLPDVQKLDALSHQVRDFLTEGLHSGDRSRAVFSAAVSLYAAGLADDEVFSILSGNEVVMGIALDHRRQDHDRALLYIWREHCCKGKARASELRALSADDFDVIEGDAPAASRDLSPVKPPRFHFLPASEFVKGDDPEYLVEDVIPQAGLVVVFGESGSGKSFFLIDIMAAVALGRPWRDKAVKQGKVAYVCAEGAGGFKRRLRAYGEHHGVALADLPIDVLGDAPNLMETADVRDLVAALRVVAPSVIVIDTLSQAIPGANENSGEDVGRALAHCRVIHKATGALVILVHHSGKDTSRGARGWSGLRAAADAEIEIVRAGDDRAATISKMKDGEDGVEYGFKLTTVSLGTNARGKEITSCALTHTVAVPKTERKKDPKGANEKLILKLVEDLTAFGSDEVSANVLLQAAVDQMLQDPDSKRDRRRELAGRALENLRDSNRVTFANGSVRLA